MSEFVEELKLKSKEELIQDVLEQDRQIDILFRIIDTKDEGLLYAHLLEELLDLDDYDVNRTIQNRLKQEKYYQQKYESLVKEDYNFIRQFLSDNHKNLNTKQFIDFLFEYMAGSFTYETTNSNLYTFLTEHKGKCWHLAHYFRDICQHRGIHTEIVKGKSQGEMHVWNRVYVDNKVYGCDVTWFITGASKEATCMVPDLDFCVDHEELMCIL
jgi:transglutaminase/protease-like cytokinesis protein 3